LWIDFKAETFLQEMGDHYFDEGVKEIINLDNRQNGGADRKTKPPSKFG
jgi:hypothetical protein